MSHTRVVQDFASSSLTDETGSIVEAYQYDAYGRPTVFTDPGSDGEWFTDDDTQQMEGESDLANKYFFQGRRFDEETQMQYFRNRYYNSRLGRFISRDPMGIWFDSASNGNGYASFSLNPLNNYDTYGFKCKKGDREITKIKSHDLQGYTLEVTRTLSPDDPADLAIGKDFTTENVLGEFAEKTAKRYVKKAVGGNVLKRLKGGTIGIQIAQEIVFENVKIKGSFNVRYNRRDCVCKCRTWWLFGACTKWGWSATYTTNENLTAILAEKEIDRHTPYVIAGNTKVLKRIGRKILSILRKVKNQSKKEVRNKIIGALEDYTGCKYK
jgi:RHS repeat-associated protein